MRQITLVALLAVALVVMELASGFAAPSLAAYNWSSPSTTSFNVRDLNSLGVRVLKPMYALIPHTRDGQRNVTAVMTVWLRRVGATKGLYNMPHQAQDAIRFMVWVDSPRNLQMRVYGHVMLPTEHSQWQPRLRVETADPNMLLEAVAEPHGKQYSTVWGQSPRPYSFRVDLPPGVGDCFKIIEASYPKHKAPVCLPPAASDGICDSLAPPAAFTAAQPALYTAVGPIRHGQSTRDWRHHMSWVAGRLVNYVSYHVAMGVTGLLQYTDEIMRSYLTQNPEIMDLIRRGHLRLIKWDMPERAHDDNDGGGRPLGYNYDQALVASHVLLGTSACGTNLLVLVTDIDEYLYFPKPGRTWPQPWGACMGPTHGSSGRFPTLFKVQRFDLVTSQVAPKDEPRMWATPAGALLLPNGSSIARIAAAATGGGGSPPPPPHPMSRYDLLFKRSMSKILVKQAQLPAAGVVLFFVHEGAVLHGHSQLVHHRCAVILHVPNFFRGRRSGAPDERRPFRHWLFLGPGDSSKLSEL